MAVTRTPAATNGSRPQVGGPGRAPGGPPPVGATQRAATRNRTRIAVGVLVMIACALGAGVLFARVADRSAVLVVTRPVRAGQVIESGALGEQLVGSRPGSSMIAASERSAIVGRTAAVDLVAGSFLAPRQLADGPVAGTGRAVIGATLKEGQYPVELSNGDRVFAVVIPAESADAAGTPTAVPAPTEATVVGVRRLDDGGGIAVSLAVAPDRSSTLAIAGARSRLTIVLAPR